MIRSRYLLLLLLSLPVGQPALLAQDAPAPDNKTTAAGDPLKPSGPPATARVEVVFQDGSKVRMKAAATGLVVATK